MDLRREQKIVDAAHIYNVASIVDRQRESEVEIVWSADGKKSLLLINRYPHAVFDFAAERGYCRTGFPKFPRSPEHWESDAHDWDETIMGFFDLDLAD